LRAQLADTLVRKVLAGRRVRRTRAVENEKFRGRKKVTYRVILAGDVAPGADPANVRRKLMAMTGQSEAVATRLLSGTPNAIKRNLSQAEAERILGMLQQIGAVASVEAEVPAFTIDEDEVVSVGADRSSTPISPRAASSASVFAANSSDAGSTLPAYLVPRTPAAASAFDATGQLTSDAMYRAIIGPRNTDYYLRYFVSRDAGGRWLSWNWPCAIVQCWWALYRKCYGFALGVFFLAIVFGAMAGAIVGGIAGVMGVHGEGIVLLGQLAGAVGGFFVGALGNAFYYRKARKLIHNTAHIGDPTARIAELARRGGTTVAWIWVLLAVFLVGVLAGIAIPAYHDYMKRAQIRSACVDRHVDFGLKI
jgi:hypothetical protein